MKEQTKDLLAEIDDYPWFSRPGIDGDAYTVVTSLSAAIKFSKSLKWCAFHTALMNRSFDFFKTKIDRGSKKYEQLATELRNESYAMAERIISRSDANYEPFLRELKGVICGAAFECEFSEVDPLQWHRLKLLPVCQLGHIVCGWDGPKLDNLWQGDTCDDLPAGKFRVF